MSLRRPFLGFKIQPIIFFFRSRQDSRDPEHPRPQGRRIHDCFENCCPRWGSLHVPLILNVNWDRDTRWHFCLRLLSFLCFHKWRWISCLSCLLVLTPYRIRHDFFQDSRSMAILFLIQEEKSVSGMILALITVRVGLWFSTKSFESFSVPCFNLKLIGFKQGGKQYTFKWY